MRVFVGAPTQWVSLGDQSLEMLLADPTALEAPELRIALQAWQSPTAELTFESTGPSGDRAVAIAIGDNAATLVASEFGQETRLAAVTPESIPALIARYAKLGPAPYSEEPVAKVRHSDLDRLARPPYERSKSLESLPCAELLSTEDWNMWSVRAAFQMADGTAGGYRIDALGAAGYGWWLLEPGRKRVTISRTRSVTLWALICSLTSAAVNSIDPEGPTTARG